MSGGDGGRPGGDLQAPGLLGAALVAQAAWAIGRLAADPATREGCRDRLGSPGAQLVFEGRHLDRQHVRAALAAPLVEAAEAPVRVGADVVDPTAGARG